MSAHGFGLRLADGGVADREAAWKQRMAEIDRKYGTGSIKPAYPAGKPAAAPAPVSSPAPAKALPGNGMLQQAANAAARRKRQLDELMRYRHGGAVVQEAFPQVGGLIHGKGTGTSDDVPLTVPEGSFIMPTDSTRAIGAENLGQMAAPVDIMASNGEFGLSREQIYQLGLNLLETMRQKTHTPVKEHAPEKGRQFFANGSVVEDDEEERLRARIEEGAPQVPQHYLDAEKAIKAKEAESARIKSAQQNALAYSRNQADRARQGLPIERPKPSDSSFAVGGLPASLPADTPTDDTPTADTPSPVAPARPAGGTQAASSVARPTYGDIARQGQDSPVRQNVSPVQEKTPEEQLAIIQALRHDNPEIVDRSFAPTNRMANYQNAMQDRIDNLSFHSPSLLEQKELGAKGAAELRAARLRGLQDQLGASMNNAYQADSRLSSDLARNAAEDRRFTRGEANEDRRFQERQRSADRDFGLQKERLGLERDRSERGLGLQAAELGLKRDAAQQQSAMFGLQLDQAKRLNSLRKIYTDPGSTESDRTRALAAMNAMNGGGGKNAFQIVKIGSNAVGGDIYGRLDPSTGEVTPINPANP
jgi:hypothetical protein